MDQQPDLKLLLEEERIKLALQEIKKPQELSVRRAAVVYKVSETTLRRRRAGKQSTRDAHPKSSAPTKEEEHTLVQYLKKPNTHGLAPTLRWVEDMANQLRAARDAKPVGPRWA
jgi:hypothetical protein